MYRQFREWAKEYGTVFSLKFGPSNIVVLCDREAIHELLDKKGSIYSDRPKTYVGDLLTRGDHIAISQADGLWREKRKVIAHNFSPKMLDEKHYRVQEAEGIVLMNDLLRNPDGFFNHIRRYTASVAATLVFGQRGATFKSFWAHAVFDVMERWTETMEPGATPPVDEFPFLKLIPKRFALWKRRAHRAGDTMDAVWTKARQIIDTRRKQGEKRDCIADRLIDEYTEKGFPMSQHAFNNLIGELVEGGADTTAAQLLTMVLALAKNPWVQKKARAEIDPVCGTSRSPLWGEDFRELPYINAVVKEGMRWRPVAVTALPHRVRQDDFYKGMLIPKDSTIFIPTWAIHHNPEFYEDDEAFNPDRFLGYPKLASEYAGSANWKDRDHYGYGAGRRVCPGMHLAERNMWRITSKLLWAFDISEPIDPVTGKTVTLDPDAYNSGITQAPLPFKVRIVPRSQEHAAALQRELKSALDFLAPFSSKE